MFSVIVQRLTSHNSDNYRALFSFILLCLPRHIFFVNIFAQIPYMKTTYAFFTLQIFQETHVQSGNHSPV